MEMNWQSVVAISVVGIAVWHLVRRALAVLHAPGRTSCGGCSNCSDPNEKQVTLVEIQDVGDVPPQEGGPANSLRAMKN